MNNYQRWEFSPKTCEVKHVSGYTCLPEREQSIVKKLLTRVHRSKLAMLIIQNLIDRNSFLQECDKIQSDRIFNLNKEIVGLVSEIPLKQPQDKEDNNTNQYLKLFWMSHNADNKKNYTGGLTFGKGTSVLGARIISNNEAIKNNE